MSKKNKDRLVHTIKFIFAIGLVYWLISSGSIDFSALRYILTPFYLGVCLLILLTSLLCNHWRWVSLLKVRGFEIEYWRSVPLTFMGLFFNFTMPGAVGGDFAKMFYLAKAFPERRMEAGTTVIIDRAVGLYVMVLLAFFAGLLNLKLILGSPALRSMFFTLLLIAFTLGLGVLLFLSRRLRVEGLIRGSWSRWKGFQILFKFISAIRQYKDHKKYLLGAALLSVISQLLAVGFFIVVGGALDENVALLAYVFAVCLGFIVSALPLSPGGVGVGQVAFLYLFKAYTNRDLQVGAIGVTLYQVLLFSLGIVGAIYFIRTTKFKKSDLEMAYD